jgi:hypothetical protein
VRDPVHSLLGNTRACWERSNLLQIISPEGETMTKVQDLREQATRAERLASSILDTVSVERLLAFAADCRKQLGVLSEPKEA